MSVVVAVRQNGRVYLATDIIKPRVGLFIPMTSESNLRIRRLKGGILIGSVGMKAITQRLYLNEKWFTPKKGEPFDKKFLVTSLIPKYIAELDRAGLLGVQSREEKDDDAPIAEATFIVVSGSDIFLIDGEFNVTEIDEIAVIGDSTAGSFIGEYMDFQDKTDIERTLLNAFKECERHKSGVCSKIVIIDNVDKEFKLYGDKI